MLSRLGIIEAMRRGDIVIDPFPDDAAMQPASLDVRIDTSGEIHHIDGSSYVAMNGALHIPGHALVLVATKERISLSGAIGARVEGKSSWGRLGLLAHVTAGFIDPGFRGPITLELGNLTKHEIVIPADAYISQLSFFKVDPPLSTADAYHGHYQDAPGAQRSIFDKP